MQVTAGKKESAKEFLLTGCHFCYTGVIRQLGHILVQEQGIARQPKKQRKNPVLERIKTGIWADRNNSIEKIH